VQLEEGGDILPLRLSEPCRIAADASQRLGERRQIGRNPLVGEHRQHFESRFRSLHRAPKVQRERPRGAVEVAGYEMVEDDLMFAERRLDLVQADLPRKEAVDYVRRAAPLASEAGLMQITLDALDLRRRDRPRGSQRLFKTALHRSQFVRSE
jgi:hypothetical protein